MITTVIFDMDGLMIDTEKVYFSSYQKVLREEGKEIDLAFFKQMLGKPLSHDKWFLKQCFGEDFPADEVAERQLAESVRRFVEEPIPLKEGIMELLQFLKAHGYKMVMATSTTRDIAEGILHKTGFDMYLQDWVCGDEVIQGKPNPEIFLKAADKMGSSSEECLVLEDSEAGIQAAHDAGMRCICVPDLKVPEKSYAKKAFRIVSTLHDVRSYLEKENIPL